MKKTLLFAFVLLVLIKIAPAQNSIMDLSIMPMLPDSLTPSGWVDVSFELKADDPSVFDNLVVLIGTLPSLGDIESDTVDILNINGSIYTSHIGDQIKIENHHARWFLRITQQQWDSFGYISIFGNIFPSGQSNSLIWEK